MSHEEQEKIKNLSACFNGLVISVPMIMISGFMSNALTTHSYIFVFLVIMSIIFGVGIFGLQWVSYSLLGRLGDKE